MTSNILTAPVFTSTFQPVLDALASCTARRACPAIDDTLWLQMMLLRIWEDCSSGRAFLQRLGLHLPTQPKSSAYFASLHSPRRLKLLDQIGKLVAPVLKADLPDPFARFAALEGFEIFAGDSHWHAAACHDPRLSERRTAVGNLFGMNLRTQGLFHMTLSDQSTYKKEHDIHALKRLDEATLRQGTPKGIKVLWVWDRACIDFRQWHEWKHRLGIYFVTRTKENLRLETSGVLDFDRSAPENAGIIEDVLAGGSTGVMVRVIRYHDTKSAKDFEFVTNELNLPPGLIAHAYRKRWDIEKVFDELKNKFHQTKSWASSSTAKTVHAKLLCLARNLMVGLLHRTEGDGIANHREARRREQRAQSPTHPTRTPHPHWDYLHRCLPRVLPLTLKFLRWFRAQLFTQAPYIQSLRHLRTIYDHL